MLKVIINVKKEYFNHYCGSRDEFSLKQVGYRNIVCMIRSAVIGHKAID